MAAEVILRDTGPFVMLEEALLQGYFMHAFTHHMTGSVQSTGATSKALFSLTFILEGAYQSINKRNS